MAAGTLTAVFAHEAEKRLLIAAADAIDRNGKHRAAGRLRAPDQCLSNFHWGDAYSWNQMGAPRAWVTSSTE